MATAITTSANQLVSWKVCDDVETNQEITKRFKPADQQDVTESAILKAAYRQALESHKELTKARHKDNFPTLKDPVSLEEVLQVVATAERKYDAKRESRRRFTKAVHSGWTNTIKRIDTFTSVINVLVSSHPEYAALVWGTIRFLFKVTLNHQELLSKINDAFAAISDALPEISFIAFDLYRIPIIQRTLAAMYTHIIDFCIRALKWYHKVTKSFFRKVLAAVKDPWALEFADVVTKIQQSIKRIQEQAAVAHQAETRYLSGMVSQIGLEVKSLRAVRAEPANDFTPERIHTILNSELFKQPSKILSTPFIPERMARYFLSIPFNPEKAFSFATALRNQRRARGRSGPDADKIWKSAKLHEWISKPQSALVQLEGSIIQTDVSRDFGLDIVDLTREAGLPVAWFLGSPLPSSDVMTVTDIMRSMVQQILQNYKKSFTESKLEEKDFASSSTEDDWIRLLVGVISQLPRVALIIDAHNNTSHILETVHKFWNVVKESNCKTTIKMLLLTYSLSGTAVPVFLKNDEVLYHLIRLAQDRRPGMMRASLSGKVKAQRFGASRGGCNGPALLKPHMARLIEAENKADE